MSGCCESMYTDDVKRDMVFGIQSRVKNRRPSTAYVTYSIAPRNQQVD